MQVMSFPVRTEQTVSLETFPLEQVYADCYLSTTVLLGFVSTF